MESSRSRSNSVTSDGGNSSAPPRCWCGKKTTMLKSWTYENPGRRFVRCDTHGFYKWVDLEPPHGWQKEALMEARDEITRLKNLHLRRRYGGEKESENESDMKEVEQEVEKESDMENAKKEVLMCKANEAMMRQFLVISWVGFVAVTAIIIAMLK